MKTLILLSFLLPLSAEAAPIVYDASHDYGSFTITGTITTDGFLGDWGYGPIHHVLDYHLVFTGSRTGELVSENSTVFYTRGVFSTESDLLFHPLEQTFFAFLADVYPPGISWNTDFNNLLGSVVVAHDGMPLHTPEPASAFLVGLGLLVAAFWRRRG